VQQRAEQSLQGRIAEVVAASLFNTKKIKSRRPFRHAITHRRIAAFARLFNTQSLPNLASNSFASKPTTSPAVSPKLPLSAQQRQPQQCRPSRPRTATRACTAQTATSNFPVITACLPLLKHTQTHTILNPSLKSSRRRHIAMARQTDMARVTRSMPFPHHHRHLRLEERLHVQYLLL